MIKDIHIKTIPHSEHRYPTTGDWWIDNDCLEIRVSDVGDYRASMAVGIHEAVEALACLADGIEPESLDRFDKAYETLREETAIGQPVRDLLAASKAEDVLREFGGHDQITEDSEPGEDLHAPYRHQHAIATQVEWIVTEAMHLPWKLYTEELADLYADPAFPTEELSIGPVAAKG